MLFYVVFIMQRFDVVPLPTGNASYLWMLVRTVLPDLFDVNTLPTGAASYL